MSLMKKIQFKQKYKSKSSKHIASKSFSLAKEEYQVKLGRAAV